ncbi:MAG TPA: ABC transporter permease [Candidatus Sulfotelmatobacter sp.]|nr:ABC transporter permease [Candidatus Sulfotelmatobacter sp.]
MKLPWDARDQRKQELDEEIQSHLQMSAHDREARGEPADQAAASARRELGNAALVREVTHDQWRWGWLDSLWQDVRFAARMLRKSPGFTAVAVLTLALGIGANTAIFSAVNGILLQRLPYPHSEELAQVSVTKTFPGTGRGVEAMVYADLGPSNWQEVRSQSPAIARFAMWTRQQFTLTGEIAPEIVRGAEVSNDFFPLLGVPPLIGRTVTAADTQPGQERVVVLSYALWRELFGGEASLQGRKINLNEQAYTIIGVMPPQFEFAMDGQRERKGLWVPLIELPKSDKKSEQGVSLLVRLQKGVSVKAFNAQLKTIAPRVSAHWGDFLRDADLVARDLKPEFGDIQTGLMILMGAVTFVLLIACVNVSALLLGRSFGRQREIAVREALGAGRLRIIRQFLTESILLSLAGGCAGILFAVWGVSALRAIAPADTMGVDRVQLDARVLWFTLGVSFLTGIVFGLVPALHASAKRSGAAFNESLTGSLSRYQSHARRLRGALVVFEIALAVILVIGATLVARSFEKLAAVDLGFRIDHLLTMSMTFSPSVCDASKTDNLDRCIGAADEARRRIQGIPGVENAASVSGLPLKEGPDTLTLTVEGQKEQLGIEAGNLIAERVVTPEYFQVVGLRLLGGRNFNVTDTKTAPRVAIVNESFARRFLAGNAIGRRFDQGDSKNKDGSPAWIEVVGVVSDSRDNVQAGGTMFPEYYLAFAQSQFPGSASVIIRTQADPLAMADAVRQQIWSVDKNAPIADVKTMDAVLSESVAAPRFRALLLGAFGALGLLLAMVGIFGVISYAVTQRTREIGVRMALGAQPRDVLRLVLGEGMLLAALGIATGAAGALALTKLLESLLYEIKPRDPATFIAVAMAVAAAAALACYIPARRAMRVDPIVALRYE